MSKKIYIGSTEIAGGDGRSAYQIWLDEGNVGTEEQFMASLNGVGIASVTQTTTSSVDGGTNVWTVTKTDGTSSTFQVKNGNQGNSGYSGAAGELEVVNNLTSTDATAALSANMGRVLDEEISQLGLKVPQNYTPLYYLDRTNALVASATSLVSDFIPCPAGATIIWKHGYTSANTAICLNLYDANKNYITGQYYSCNVANSRTFTIAAADVAYVRASFYSASKTPISLSINGSVVWERIDGGASTIQSESTKIATEVVDKKVNGLPRNYKIGKVTYANSNRSYSFKYDYINFGFSDPIHCVAGDAITWDAGRPSSGYADADFVIIFVDSSNAYVGYYTATAGGARTVIAPPNSAACEVGFLRGSAAYVDVNNVRVWTPQDGTVPTGSDEMTIYPAGSFIYWNSEYAATSNGVFRSSSVNSRTGFIDVSDLATVKFVMPVVPSVSNAGFCFYRADGTFISGVMPSVVASSTAEVDYEWREAKVPSGAKYAVASIYTALRDHFELIGIKATSEAAAEDKAMGDMQQPLVERVVIGTPSLHISEAVATQATSLNAKTVAELYAEYDAMVTAHPEMFIREADLGTVTRSSDQAEFQVRAYTLGFHQQTAIDHEPTASEVISANIWDSANNPRKILVMSGMHGDEKTPTWGLMLAIKDILESDDPWANYIKANAIIKIVPCLNPVGWDTCTRADSQGNILNHPEAVNDPEAVMEMNWVNANKDAFILLDWHGTQGRYAYMPVMDKFPMTPIVSKLANQLAAALQSNWKSFYNSQVSGYGTTYAPYLVAKTTAPANYVGTGLLAYNVLVNYGVFGFTIETPDNLTDGLIGTNDLRNCKLTKDMVFNVLQFFINLPYTPDIYYR